MALLSKLLSGTPKVEVNREESPRPDYEPSYGRETKAKERVTIDKAQSVATGYRPKNIISDDVVKKAVIEWRLFYGNSYIWSPMVGPRQLLILPANRTMPVFDTQGSLWYQHTFSNNKVEYIPSAA